MPNAHFLFLTIGSTGNFDAHKYYWISFATPDLGSCYSYNRRIGVDTKGLVTNIPFLFTTLQDSTAQQYVLVRVASNGTWFTPNFGIKSLCLRAVLGIDTLLS